MKETPRAKHSVTKRTKIETKFVCSDIPYRVQILDKACISLTPYKHIVVNIGPYNKKDILTILIASHSILSSERLTARAPVSTTHNTAEYME